MTLSEFARERNQDVSAIKMYMKRHGMEYDRTNGLTDKQLDSLDKQYPLPKPVTVVDGIPERDYIDALERLEKAKDKMFELQNKLFDVQLQISEQKSDKLLLEEKTENLKKELMEKADEISKLREQLTDVQKENEELRNRKFLDYLFGRK